MPKPPMTLNDLAAALMGMPRDAVMMIDTPDGPRELRRVRGAHGRRRDDGALASLEGGVSVSQSTGYLVILSAEV